MQRDKVLRQICGQSHIRNVNSLARWLRYGSKLHKMRHVSII